MPKDLKIEHFFDIFRRLKVSWVKAYQILNSMLKPNTKWLQSFSVWDRIHYDTDPLCSQESRSKLKRYGSIWDHLHKWTHLVPDSRSDPYWIHQVPCKHKAYSYQFRTGFKRMPSLVNAALMISVWMNGTANDMSKINYLLFTVIGELCQWLIMQEWRKIGDISQRIHKISLHCLPIVRWSR